MGIVKDFVIGKTAGEYQQDYNNAIKSAKQSKADDAYNYYYNRDLYNLNKDYFDKNGVANPTSGYSIGNTMKQYQKYINNLESEKQKIAKQNKYNVAGDGLIGTIVNPVYQTATGLGDIFNSGAKAWTEGDRDWLSDLGAAGQTALNIFTLGQGGAAASAGKAALKAGAIGAGYGALGSINRYGTDIGDNLGNAALSTAIGGTLGAGAGALGYGINKMANRAQGVRAYQDYINQYNKYRSADANYSNLLGDGVGGASVSSSAPSAAYSWLSNRGNLAKTKLGQAIQGIGDTISLRNINGNNLYNKISDYQLGKATANLLKTKTGKALAGTSAGLTLAALLKNKNNNGDK